MLEAPPPVRTVPLAPPPDAAPRTFTVLLAGAATTALALVIVHLSNQAGENIMGWYGDYVIPVGALLVGLVASSGFGAGSWWSGCKITGRLLWMVTGMLAAGYLLAQLLDYRQAVPDGQIGFWRYFDAVTRSFYWKSDSSGPAGTALGMWGYGLRALEVVGFVGGGVLIPVALRKKPYCDPCRLYKRTERLAYLPAGVIYKKRKAGSPEALDQDERARVAYQAASAETDQIFQAGADSAEALAQRLAETPAQSRRSVGRVNARIAVNLVRCRHCHDGELVAEVVMGQGKQIKRRPLKRAQVPQATVAKWATSRRAGARRV
ncbi:MAG TPA: hypothetical protein VII38_12900 [Polyangia bacterium]|jgi:hypothetical protein